MLISSWWDCSTTASQGFQFSCLNLCVLGAFPWGYMWEVLVLLEEKLRHKLALSKFNLKPIKKRQPETPARAAEWSQLTSRRLWWISLQHSSRKQFKNPNLPLFGLSLNGLLIANSKSRAWGWEADGSWQLSEGSWQLAGSVCVSLWALSLCLWGKREMWLQRIFIIISLSESFVLPCAEEQCLKFLSCCDVQTFYKVVLAFPDHFLWLVGCEFEKTHGL